MQGHVPMLMFYMKIRFQYQNQRFLFPVKGGDREQFKALEADQSALVCGS